MIVRTKNKIRKFFFCDPICLEFISSFSLGLFAFFTFLSLFPIVAPYVGVITNDPVFFTLLFFFLSTVQFVSLMFPSSLRVLRCVSCYMVGIFWVWISISSVYFMETINIGDVSSFMLGLGMIYSFFIHIIILRKFHLQRRAFK